MPRTDRVPAERFLKDLSSSDLVSDELVEVVREDAGPAADCDTLVAEFVRRGILTAYQAEAAARGKAPRLVIGNYVVLEPAGRGGMGRVFKAVHRRMKRTVALKVLAVPPGRNGETRRRRFRREAEAAARLDHPNVVAVYDAGTAGGDFYLVMQYIGGSDLDELVGREGPLPIGRTADLISQAAAGLGHAHARGLVHRDVKPANLMLAADGTLKVLDLGLARFDDSADPGLTRVGTTLGTVSYMAPELADDAREAGPQADLYGLGCTLHFLLTGRPVYARQSPVGTLTAHRTAEIPSLRAARTEVPAAIDELFRSMVAKRPGDRPSDAGRVVAALAPFRRLPTSAFTRMDRSPEASASPAEAGNRGSRPGSDAADLFAQLTLAEPIPGGANVKPAAKRDVRRWVGRKISVPRDAIPLVAAGLVLVVVAAWLLIDAVVSG